MTSQVPGSSARSSTIADAQAMPRVNNVVPFPGSTRTTSAPRRRRGGRLPRGVANFTEALRAREWAGYEEEAQQAEVRRKLLEVLDDLRTLAQAEELDALMVVFRTRDGTERQVVTGPAYRASNPAR